MSKIKTFYYGDFNRFQYETGELLGCVCRDSEKRQMTMLVIGLPNGNIIERPLSECKYIPDKD